MIRIGGKSHGRDVMRKLAGKAALITVEHALLSPIVIVQQLTQVPVGSRLEA
jgi:phosphohistidine swiveling domain-containing protein